MKNIIFQVYKKINNYISTLDWLKIIKVYKKKIKILYIVISEDYILLNYNINVQNRI